MPKPIIKQAQTLAEYEPAIYMLPARLTVGEDGKLNKVPTLKWKQDGPFTLAQVIRALKRTNALGIDLGASKLVTLDVDSYKRECNFDEFIEEAGLSLPYTWQIKSGSGGTHYVFANPHDLQFRGKLPGVEAVDIKAAGGFSVIPPSRVDDHAYEWVVGPDELPEGPAMVPQWLMDYAGKDGTEGDLSPQLAEKVNDRNWEDNQEVIAQLRNSPNTLDDREDWLRIGMGLFFEFQDTPSEGAARYAFLAWSAKWDDSQEAADNAASTWDSFPRIDELTTTNPVTIGTVRKYITDNQPPPTEEEITKIRETVDELSKKKVEGTDFTVRFADLLNIPPRQWVHGTDALKGEVTMVPAPGGVGKSSTVLVMLLSMVTGRALLGRETYGKHKAMLWSGEDGRVEIGRRLSAAMKHYKITEEDIGDRLHIVTHDDLPLTVAHENQKQAQGQPTLVVNKTDVDYLIGYMRDNGIEVAAFDPLVEAHQLDENNNSHAHMVMQAFKKVALMASAAVILVHHVGKGSLRDDSKGDPADAARGATAFINAARVSIALKQMSLSDAGSFRIDNPSDYAEIIDAKANLSRRGVGGQRWIEKISVNIGNGTDVYPDGDDVGVVRKWTPTAEMKLSLAENLMSVLTALMDEHTKHEEEGAGFIFQHEQNSHWAGKKIAEVLNLPIGEEGSADRRSDKENENRRVIRSYFSELMGTGGIALEPREKPGNRHFGPAYIVDGSYKFDLLDQIKEIKSGEGIAALTSINAPRKVGKVPNGGAKKGS